MFERALEQVSASVAIDPITSLTLVLAALTALLTVLAIIIGLAAVFGYFGIRDSVREMASKKVDEAMANALKEYPLAADMFGVLERLRKTADFWDQMRNQAVTAPEPKTVAKASKPIVQVEQAVGAGEVSATPLESTQEQVTPIEQYPGEEEADDNVDGKTKQ